ncbi:MAG: beta-ketoacyl synthase chain length factor [Victivallales bacterium]|nr:beta-ketoacyl synthase chain length factor [Victivallales bacterium]
MSTDSFRTSPRMRVYGTGLAHSLGNLEQFYQAVDHFQPTPGMQNFPSADTSCLRASFTANTLRRIPHYARMGLAAALDALKALPSQVAQKDVGLVIATAHAGQKNGLDFMDSILDNGPRLSSPTAFSHAVNNMGTGLISLYLNLQGPCCTVTQFELSFAGALQAAGALLYGNQAPLVLLGCMDELDTRFTKVCSAYLGTAPQTRSEGAAFFLLGKSDGIPPELSVDWNASVPNAKPTPLQSKAYGITPISASLDTLLALHAPFMPLQSISCTSTATHQQAVIHVHR